MNLFYWFGKRQKNTGKPNEKPIMRGSWRGPVRVDKGDESKIPPRQTPTLTLVR